MTQIHPTAIIHPKAEIASCLTDVSFSVVETTGAMGPTSRSRGRWCDSSFSDTSDFENAEPVSAASSGDDIPF